MKYRLTEAAKQDVREITRHIRTVQKNAFSMMSENRQTPSPARPIFSTWPSTLPLVTEPCWRGMPVTTGGSSRV
jgi:hypothetical protein